MKLKGRTAIVTGAGSGMGKAIATLYAQEGAKVIAADLNDSIHAVVDEIKSNGGEATAVIANVTKQEDVDNLVKATVDTYGSLDILVNNAGVMDNFEPVADVTDEVWERVISVNLTGPLRVSRAAIKVMNNQENGGVIVNIASVGGLFGARGGASYVASKHGLIGLTKNIAATYGTFGKIRANAIAPGGVNTNITSHIKQPNELGMKAMGGAGQPPESADPIQIARVALFLASDDSDYINGDVIKVDGGWTAR